MQAATPGIVVWPTSASDLTSLLEPNPIATTVRQSYSTAACSMAHKNPKPTFVCE